MKKLVRLFFLILYFMAFNFANALVKNPELRSQIGSGFIENKGQIIDQNRNANADVKFLLNIPGLNIQLKANGFSYDTYTIDQKEKLTNSGLTKHLNLPNAERIYHFHRIDVEFIGANLAPEIITEGASENYFNYFTTGTSLKGATKVRSFQRIIYKNLYPNIDLEFLSKEGKLKYNFILHYGANIDDIKWKYRGAENTSLKNNNIEIKVQQGLIAETIPESFLSSSTGILSKVNIEFIAQKNNIYSFSNIDNALIKPDQKLTIDPTPNLLWATYFGKADYEAFVESCSDKNGNIYFAGWTTAVVSIATSGAFQTTYAGGLDDGLITKFNSSGILKWATYYGGPDDDWAMSIVIDKFSNLFISGYTASTISISTPGTHQVNYGGGAYDVFVTKFDTTGARQWATYYGGTGYDYPGAIKGASAIDSSGNFYISGKSTSTNAIATGGAFQTTNAGGAYDAFLAKFNNNGVIQWGTYYGDNGDDESLTCATDLSGNIYFSGVTTSSSSISTSGSHQLGYGGGTDVFIVKFNSNGSRKWGTYYGGAGKDEALNIHFDPSGSLLYISGDTNSNDSIATSGTQQTIFGGGIMDAFVVSFDTNGVRKWGTYYGGNDWEQGTHVTTDNSAVYICGNSKSGSGIATPNAYQINYTGGPYGDAILVKFSKNGLCQWGTYYGGSLWECLYTMLLNAAGDIYTAGITCSSSGISTSGSYQPVFGGFYDAILAKFNNPYVATGISENKIEINNLTIFPNPNNGSFTLLSKQDLDLNLVNELGQFVKTVNLNNSNGHQSIISNLECGVYFLVDKQKGEVIQNKVVVIK